MAAELASLKYALTFTYKRKTVIGLRRRHVRRRRYGQLVSTSFLVEALNTADLRALLAAVREEPNAIMQ